MSKEIVCVDVKDNKIGMIGNNQKLQVYINKKLRFEYYWKEGEKPKKEATKRNPPPVTGSQEAK